MEEIMVISKGLGMKFVKFAVFGFVTTVAFGAIFPEVTRNPDSKK